MKRRDYLKALGASGAGLLGGCVTDDESHDETYDGGSFPDTTTAEPIDWSDDTTDEPVFTPDEQDCPCPSDTTTESTPYQPETTTDTPTTTEQPHTPTETPETDGKGSVDSVLDKYETVSIPDGDFHHYTFDLYDDGFVTYSFKVHDGPRIEAMVLPYSEFDEFGRTHIFDDVDDLARFEAYEAQNAGDLPAGEYVLAFDNSIRGETYPIQFDQETAKVTVTAEAGVYST